MENNLEEISLDYLVNATVINSDSAYKGINVLLSHTAKVVNKNWFKVFTGYSSNAGLGIQLWFSEEELLMREGWELVKENPMWGEESDTSDEVLA